MNAKVDDMLRPGSVVPVTPETVATLVCEVVKARSALKVALEEIDWWTSEHGCCLGHEKYAVDRIREALGETLPSAEDVRGILKPERM